VKSPIIGEPYIGHDGAGGVGGVGGVGAGGLQLSPGHVQGLAEQPEETFSQPQTSLPLFHSL